MISRRAALNLGAAGSGLGIAAIVAQRAGVLDDGLRAAGIRPHAEPDPHDVSLLAEAAGDQAALIAAVDSLGQGEHASELAAIRAVLAEQLDAVSDQAFVTPSAATGSSDRGGDIDALADRAEAVAAARADGALAAASLALTKVLASMSAGLEQVAVDARRLA